MSPRFVDIEFDEFIFDNFKHEIAVYIKKDSDLFLSIRRVDSLYVGKTISMHGYITKFFSKEELYMAVPSYLYEIFDNLKQFNGKRTS